MESGRGQVAEEWRKVKRFTNKSAVKKVELLRFAVLLIILVANMNMSGSRIRRTHLVN